MAVVVAVVVVVVLSGCECGTRTHQDQDRGEDELLHAEKTNTIFSLGNTAKDARIKSANGVGNCPVEHMSKGGFHPSQNAENLPFCPRGRGYAFLPLHSLYFF